MKEEFLTIQEAAEFFGVSTRTLRRWEEKGYLTAQRTFGNQRRYSKTQLKSLFTVPSVPDVAKTQTTENIQNNESYNPIIASLRSSQTNDQVNVSPVKSLVADDFQPIIPSEKSVHGFAMPSQLIHEKHAKQQHWVMGLAGVSAGLVLLFLSAIVISNAQSLNTGRNAFTTWLTPDASDTTTKGVLAAEDSIPNLALQVNVPAVFGKKATFLDAFEIKNSLRVDKASNLFGGINTNNNNINAGTGTVTASNIIYSVLAGSNVTITGDPQNPTISATGGVDSVQGQTGAVAFTEGTGIGLDGLEISNTGVLSLQGQTGALSFTQGSGISVSGFAIANIDPGSAQKIYGTFRVGSTDLTAGSNTDTITFAAGSGITLSPNAGSKTITITSDAAGVLSGLTTNGVLYATSATTATSTAPGANGYILKSNGSGTAPEWVAPGTVLGFVPFDFITSGTNTAAAMVMGSGASLGYTGTGTINASSLQNATWVSPGAIGSTTANTGAFTTLTATTLNGLTVTANSSNTLTIATGKTITLNNSLALSGTDGTAFTFPSVSGTLVSRDSTDTLTNKTIAAGSNTITGLTNSNLSGTAGITNANLANSSVTVTAGAGLSGGGLVSLGGSIALANAGVTSATGATGISINASTGDITITNDGVTSLSGTTNQVVVSGGSGSVTLSLPQDIHAAATPTFGGLTLASFVSNGGLLYTNGSGAFAQSSTLFAGTNGLGIGSNAIGNGKLVINQENATGDIFSASSSGTTRLTLSNGGNLNLTGTYYANGVAGITQGSASCVTTTNGIVTGFGTCQLGSEQWEIANGAIYTGNPSLDLILGGTSTDSAKFAVINISGGTPTATISAETGDGAAYLAGNGVLGTANAQTLTLGSASTGNIVIDAGSGSIVLSDSTTVNGGVNLSLGNGYSINGASVLNATTLGTNVVNSSLTSVGALTGGSIASGFGTISTGNNITTTSTVQGGTVNSTGALQTNGTSRIDSSGNVVNANNVTAGGVITLGGLQNCDTINTDGSGVLSCGTDADTTYTAGNDLDLTGTTFSVESTLDFVEIINLAGTGTLNGVDVIDAATESTIESAIDTLANLVSITMSGDTITDFTGTGLQMSGNSLTTTLGDSIDLTNEITGVLGIANGGTNKNLTLSNGGILWSDADSFEVLSAAGSAGLALVSGGAGTPAWFAPTQGSVLFAGVNGALTQDNASFYFDDTNNRFGIGVNSNLLSTLDVRGQSGTTPIASFSGQTVSAGLIVDNNGLGDLFTASKSGATKFVINNTGQVGIGQSNPAYQGVNTRLALKSGAGNATDLILEDGNGTNIWSWFANTGGQAGLYDISNDNAVLTFEEGAPENAVYVDSTGNVGIGIANAGQRLQVAGNIDAYDGGTQQALLVATGSLELANTANGAFIDFKTSTAEDYDARIEAYSNGLALRTGGSATQRHLFDANGLVGFNTVTPLATLDVRGASGILPIASLSGQTSNAGFIIDNNGVGDLFTASKSGATKFTITNSGTVAIGPFTRADVGSTPTGTLHLWGNVDSTNSVMHFGDVTDRSNAYIKEAGTTDSDQLELGGREGLVFATGGSGSSYGVERMSIDISGNVAINNLASCNTIDTDANGVLICGTDEGGSASTLQGAYDGDVNGSDSILALNANDDSLIFRNPASGGTDSTFLLNLDQLATGARDALVINSAGADANFGLRVNDDGTSSDSTPFVVDNTGSVGIGTTAPGAKLQVSADSAGDFATEIYNNNATGLGGYIYTNNSTATDILRLESTIGQVFNVKSNGSIGVNTSISLATLDVRGNIGTTPVASFSGQTAQAAMIVDNNGVGDLFTASKSGATKFVITNAGNIGISTATPRSDLDLGRDGAILTLGGLSSGATIRFGAATDTNAIGYNNNGFNFLTDQTNGFEFFTNTDSDTATAEFRITNAGNVGIGSAAPSTLLQVTGAKNANSGAGTAANYLQILRNNNANDGQGAGIGFISNTSDTDIGGNIILTRNGSGGRGDLSFGVKQSGSGGAAPVEMLSLNADNTVDLGGTTLNATSLATINLGGTTTINGGTAANNDLTLQGTSNATRASSYVFIQPNGGAVGIGNVTTPLATLDIRGNIGTTPVASVSGTTAMASLVVDNNGIGDLFVASKSGATKFTVLNNGNVRINNLASCGSITTDGTGLLSCSGAASSLFTDGGAVTYLTSLTDDLALGGTSSSAPFFFDESAEILTLTNTTGGDSFIVNDVAGDVTPFVIDASGNVGIGDPTPGAKLDVNGVSRFNFYIDSAAYGISVGGGLNTAQWNTSIPYFLFNSSDDLGYIFKNNSGARDLFKLEANGTAGLGVPVDAPMLATLDIRAQSGTLAIASIAGSTTRAGLLVDNNGLGDLFTASKSGATKFVVKNSGNVGIGTANPEEKLHVSGSILVPNASWFMAETVAGANATLLGIDVNDTVLLNTSASTTGITIRNDGNVGIGVTDPNEQLHVDGRLRFTDSQEDVIYNGNAKIFTGTGPETAADGNLDATALTGIADFGEGTGVNGLIFQYGGTTDAGGMKLTDDGLVIWGAGDDDLLRIYNEDTSSQMFAITDAGNLDTEGTIQFDTASDDNERLCHTGADGAVLIDIIIEDCTVAGEDFAEYALVKDAGAEPGDIVYTVGPDTANPKLIAKAKTNKAYQNHSGVISTNPFIDVLGDEQYKGKAGAKPIALAGRIPVKVSTENGSIAIGDPLAASSIPGVAMKATRASYVIGFAQEAYDGSVRISEQVLDQETIYNSDLDDRTAYNSDASTWATGVGKIVAEYKPTWFDPSVTFNEDGNLSYNGQALSNGSLPDMQGSASTSSVNNNASLSVGLCPNGCEGFDATVFNDRVATSSALNKVQDDVSSFSAIVNGLTDRIASLENLASGSAFFGSSSLSAVEGFVASTAAELSLDTLDVTDATVSNTLAVLGRTTLSDVGITGRVNIGLLSIEGLDEEGLASINTSAGALQLQSNGLNGIDILDGKMTIDTKGNIVTEGEITTKKVNIDTEDVASASLGEVLLEEGTTKVVVTTKALTEDSKIFVQAQEVPVVTAVKKIASDKFEIRVRTAETTDVKLSWWIVN